MPTPHPLARTDIDAQAPAVLAALQERSYEQVAADFNTSRGKVYSIALRAGARKNEARIRERAAERKARQRQFLESVINATETADVLDFLDGLPSDSVAMHLTSPPYNEGGTNVADPAGSSRIGAWSGHSPAKVRAGQRGGRRRLMPRRLSPCAAALR